MKKIFCLLFCLIIFCSGCNKKSSSVTAVTSGLSFNARITDSVKTQDCFVKISESGNTEMSLDIVDGMTLDLSFDNSRLDIKHGEIEYKTDLASLPKSSVIDFIHTVFLSAAKDNKNVVSSGENLILVGNTQKYNYKIYLGATGLPLKIEDEKNNITVEITNATIKK